MLKKRRKNVIKKSLKRLNKNVHGSYTYRVCLLRKKTFSRKSPFVVVEPAAGAGVFICTFVLFIWDQEGSLRTTKTQPLTE